MNLPTKKETSLVLLWTALYWFTSAVFIGLRPEHFYISAFFLAMFFPSVPTRKLAVALLPFALFGISYDWMRLLPNYEVNPIDIRGLYEAEKHLFGITDGGNLLTLNEFFRIHSWKLADFLSGIFYLCWVPVPMAFGVWLYLKKERDLYLRFSMVFLLVNLIGFVGYYIHPAAPPWYVMQYGFEPILNTPGSTAGLERFDELTGWGVFGSIYSRNANVFAALPSLHSAYMIIPLWYAIRRKSSWPVVLLFAIILCGIWFSAVYNGHHYLIDVILGVFCAIIGILLFEKVLMKTKWFSRFFHRYYEYIK